MVGPSRLRRIEHISAAALTARMKARAFSEPAARKDSSAMYEMEQKQQHASSASLGMPATKSQQSLSTLTSGALQSTQFVDSKHLDVGRWSPLLLAPLLKLQHLDALQANASVDVTPLGPGGFARSRLDGPS